MRDLDFNFETDKLRAWCKKHNKDLKFYFHPVNPTDDTAEGVAQVLGWCQDAKPIDDQTCKEHWRLSIVRDVHEAFKKSDDHKFRGRK